MAGQYRVPDEKTIRVVLDRLDPRALARALLGSRPGSRRAGGAPPASVRGYRARRAAQRANALARGRLRAVAVDGKTCRGARRGDGTRVYLLGAAEHGGGCWITSRSTPSTKAIRITRWRQEIATGRVSRETVYAVTSLDSAEATAADLARLVRGQWPGNLAAIRAAVIAALKDASYLHIPEGCRDHTTPAETFRLHGLD
jgi:hypothetical protein